ncbi:MAG: zinc-ribbon domain-containing protein [Methanobrevibacter sp.]|jgi:uncharacterized Zn finger protein (UPF0148 family)|nr:zinc-ribbon domain-containing protein [Candidatus Methanoflexus mossambicus]
MTQKFCDKCGNSLSKHDKFCGKCGAKIEFHENIKQTQTQEKKKFGQKEKNELNSNSIINKIKLHKNQVILGSVLILILILCSVILIGNPNVISNNKTIINDVTVDFFESDVSAEYSMNKSAYTSYSWTVYAYSNVGDSLKNYMVTCKFYDDKDQLVDTSDNEFSYYDNFNEKVIIGSMYSDGINYDIVKIVVDIKDKTGKTVQTINQKVEVSLQ